MKVKNGPIGTMNLDDEVHYINKGDYGKAMGIRHSSQELNGGIAVEDVLGNERAFDTGVIEAQNKKYRIYIDSTSALSHEVTVTDANGVIIDSAASFSTTAGNIATSLNDAMNAIFAAITTPNTISQVTTGANTGYLDFNLSAILGYEFFITSTGTDDLDFDIIQEAYDVGLAGNLDVISSRYQQGYQFIWSAATATPSELFAENITNVADNGAGLIRITSSVALSLVTGQSVFLFGINNAWGVNGTWIVTRITSTSFDLQASTFTSGGASTGSAIINRDAVSELGVAVKDPYTDTWTYTRLLRSKVLGFRKNYKIRNAVEWDGEQWNFYWVDKLNNDRAAYYKGDFVADGFITVFNTEGLYAYDTLLEETRQVQATPSVGVDLEGQDEQGGILLNGNYRYFVRFLNTELSQTAWAGPSGIVPVYAAVKSDVYNLIGDDVGSPTSKINNLRISNIPTDLFKYMEIAFIHYTGKSFSGAILRRVLITGDTMIVRHTGSEINQQDLDAGTLNTLSVGYDNSGDIAILDGRLLKADLSSEVIEGLDDWAHDIQYSLETKEITGGGDASNGTAVFAEYFDPANAFYYIGYQANETYRFAIELETFAGTRFPAFHIADITFDTTGASGQRLSGLASYDINPAFIPVFGSYVNIFYIRFTNMDWDFILPSGKRVRDVIKKFRIVRVECIPEILATGIMHNAVFDSILPSVRTYEGFADPNTFFPSQYPTFTAARKSPVALLSDGVPGAEKRQFGFFNSIDLRLGKTTITPTVGDKLIVFPFAAGMISKGYRLDSTNPAYDYYDEFATMQSSFHAAPITYDIEEGAYVLDGQLKQFLPLSGVEYRLKTTFSGGANPDIDYVHQDGIVFKVSADIIYTGPVNEDFGTYYAQYYRPLVDKYGDPALSKYIPCMLFRDIASTEDATSTYDVFGGDVFNQCTYRKQRKTGRGWGGGYSYYSQNRSNSQLRNSQPTGTGSGYLFPPTTPTRPTIGDELGAWLDKDAFDPYGYDEGYSANDKTSLVVGNNENEKARSEFITRIIYSQLKPNASNVDNYRIFLPLDFKDYDFKDGRVTAIQVWNGELIVFQWYNFRREYFNTSGILSSKDGSEVVIGDGAVLRAKGNSLSFYGCKHKFGIVVGKSKSGKELLYWPSTEHGKWMRFGFDGTLNISDLKKMNRFFVPGTKWADAIANEHNYDTDIVSVWDDENNEAIFTVRAHRKGPLWTIGTDYVVGNYVLLSSQPTGTYSTFEQTVEIYECIADHTSGSLTDPDSGIDWQDVWRKVSHDEHQYFNEYTVSFDETKNGWATFYPFLPKIYLQHANTFLTPRPVENTHFLYEHNKGEYLTWYKDDTAVTSDQEQAIDGYLEQPMNYDMNMNKQMQAIWFNTLLVPYYVELRTKTAISYLEDTDFEDEKDQWTAAIKNDSTITVDNPSGLNSVDSDQLYGTYLWKKFFFENRVRQSLVNYIVKFAERSRHYTT